MSRVDRMVLDIKGPGDFQKLDRLPASMRFGAMIITVTATRVIASFLTGPDDPGPEDVNNMLTYAEGLFDVR